MSEGKSSGIFLNGKKSRSYGRSINDFGELLSAEKLLVESVRKGEHCKLGKSRPIPEKASPENTIRASFLRFLILGGDDQVPIHEKGIDLTGAYITGELDLENCKQAVSFKLAECHFSKQIILHGGTFHHVSLRGSYVPGINAGRCTINGSLRLYRHFKSSGEIRLNGSRITGQLYCTDSHLETSGKFAVLARGAYILGGANFTRSTIKGKVDLEHADIGSDLDFTTANLHNGHDYALNCYSIRIADNLLLEEGFEAHGGVSLVAAQIGGKFSCAKGLFIAKKKYSIDGQSMKVSGPIYMRNGFEAKGTVRLNGITAGSKFDCKAGLFNTPKGASLLCEYSKIEADVLLSKGFEAHGRVQFNGTVIDGDLACDGGEFHRTEVAQNKASKSIVDTDFALNLTNIVIKNGLYLASPEQKDRKFAHFNGSLCLDSAYTRILIDHPDAWPKGADDKIELDGFIYDRFGNSPCDSKLRISWLKKQPIEHLYEEFKPQPFEHLIKVLREMGHEDEARDIAVFKQSHKLNLRFSRHVWLAPVYAFEWLFLGKFLGFGYRPLRLMVLLVLLWLGAAQIYSQAAQQQVFAPKDSRLFMDERLAKCRPANGGNWTACDPEIAKLYEEYTSFNSYLYSLDLIVPVVDLEQEDDWAPILRPFKLSFPLIGDVEVWPWFARFVMWFEIVFGWVSSLLLIAAFSGLVKKE